MAFSDSKGFTEALGIVYGLLTSARQAEENLQAQHVGVVKLSPMDATLERLPPTLQLTEKGAAFALDSTCLAALTKLRREDKFEGIHVVDRALFVSRFRIELERPPEYTLDAMEVLGVDSDHESQSKGPNAVEIMAPLLYRDEFDADCRCRGGCPRCSAEQARRQGRSTQAGRAFPRLGVKTAQYVPAMRHPQRACLVRKFLCPRRRIAPGGLFPSCLFLSMTVGGSSYAKGLDAKPGLWESSVTTQTDLLPTARHDLSTLSPADRAKFDTKI
jgi:hypothetical protein